MALSPAEAAVRLMISERRVRALLEQGRIPAQRVSGRWVIDEAAVGRHQSGGPAGRPLSERSAWQLVDYFHSEASVECSANLAPVERHRLKKRVERLKASPDPQGLLRALLAKRAEKIEYSSSPADLAELREDPRLHLSGVSHRESGLLSASEIEAYVSREDHSSLVRDWFLVRAHAGQRPNVILHIAEKVPDELPPILIAADLAERPGVREQQAARDILRRILVG